MNPSVGMFRFSLGCKMLHTEQEKNRSVCAGLVSAGSLLGCKALGSIQKSSPTFTVMKEQLNEKAGDSCLGEGEKLGKWFCKAHISSKNLKYDQVIQSYNLFIA